MCIRDSHRPGRGRTPDCGPGQTREHARPCRPPFPKGVTLNALRQTWRVACYEWFDALRSRRALVVLLLYLAAAVCNMYWSINLLHKLETELASALQLPASEQAGVVSTALWKSKPFQRMMTKMTQNDLVLRDITGKRHSEKPIEKRGRKAASARINARRATREAAL